MKADPGWNHWCGACAEAVLIVKGECILPGFNNRVFKRVSHWPLPFLVLGKRYRYYDSSAKLIETGIYAFGFLKKTIESFKWHND